VLDNLPDHPSREGLGRDPLFVHGPVPGLAEAARDWEEPPESAADRARARRQVIELLGISPTAVDDVVRRCQFSPAAVMGVLLELELAGRIQTLSGNRVALLPDTGF
jgi:DNA processing protein